MAQQKEQVKSNGLSKNDHFYPLRVSQDTFARIRKLAEQETRRIGRPQPVASVLRQIVALGLNQLEKMPR